MSSQVSVGPGERQERVEDRLVGPARIGPEEARHRAVEVGLVGDLAEAVDLVAIAPDAVGPGQLGQVRPACRHRGCRRRARPRRRAPDGPPGSGPRPRSPRASATTRRAGPQDEDRVRAAAADGSAARRTPIPAGTSAWASARRTAGSTSGWSPSTTKTPSSVRARVGRRSSASSADPQRARQPGLGIRVDDPSLARPGDRRLDRLGVRARGRRPSRPGRPPGPRRGRGRGSAGRRAARGACRRRTGSRPRRRGRSPRSASALGHRSGSAAGAQARAAASSSIGRPDPPCRSATISAMIARAVSAGARPPRSSPIGPRSRPSSSAVTPAASSRVAPIGLGLARADRPDVAAAAPERLDDRRLVELHVVGEHRHRVRRARARSRRRPRPASRRPAGRRRGTARGVANAARPSMTTVS